MPEFRFRMPLDWELSSYHANSVFIVGLDGVPWPCRVKVDSASDFSRAGAILHVSRHQPESGKLFCVYPTHDRGEMILCTGTLPVQETIHDLLTELARGTLNRLRNQISMWREGGLVIAESLHQTVSQSVVLLGQAIMADDQTERDRLARHSIQLSIDAIFELSQTFGSQIAKFRREKMESNQFWLANTMGHDTQCLPSIKQNRFDLFQPGNFPVPKKGVSKRQVVGPWLDASVGGMDQELTQIDNFQQRREHLLTRCRNSLEQLPKTASLLHLISGLNGLGHRHLSYPQQLQLATDLLSQVDEALIEVPVMISFDFPWAERLAGAVGGIHPLQIADSLLRQGINVSYLGLDINLDYWPNGSAIRDPLQWIELIDTWAQLELPLVLCLRVPSNGVVQASEPGPLVNQPKSDLTEGQRLKYLETVLPMMVARPIVHGIIWRQWQDGDDIRYPLGGLVDSDGKEKPICQLIDSVRACARK